MHDNEHLIQRMQKEKSLEYWTIDDLLEYIVENNNLNPASFLLRIRKRYDSSTNRVSFDIDGRLSLEELYALYIAGVKYRCG